MLVLYPHDDVLMNQSGASRRVNLLVGTLTSWGLEVRVLQGGSAARGTISGSVVEALGAEPRLLLRRLSLSALVWSASLGKGMRHWWIFWQFARVGMGGPFRRHIRQQIAWADVVFLEYAFLTRPVAAVARRLDRRLILNPMTSLWIKSMEC